MSDSETLPEQSNVESPKITYKRRSSIFHGARLLEDIEVTKNDDGDDTGDKNENASDEESFDLPAYIESLRNERKAWKETLKERKSRRRKLQKEKAIIDKQGADYDLDILSESERSFVLGRLPYEDIAKNISILSDGAIKVARLHRDINYLNNRLTLKIEEKMFDATKRLIEMSNGDT